MSLQLTPGDNLNVVIAANPLVTKYTLPIGTYYLDDILTITRNNLSIIGLGKASETHIYQQNVNRDGINIRADSVVIKNVSVHVPHSKRVALTVAGCNKSKVTKCYFYGSRDFFTIYYAGPPVKAGEATINAYLSNQLDNRHNFSKNVVYANYSGDAVSFSLQYDGRFVGNIIRGGKLAVYMCRDSQIDNNHIYDSNSHGIYVSLPSHNLTISNNNMYECKNSSLIIKQQREHTYLNGDAIPISDYNMTIDGNCFYDNDYFGIEINEGQNINITNNKFLHNEVRGLYLQSCSNIVIKDNILSYFKIAIELLNISECQICNNTFYSVYPVATEKGIILSTYVVNGVMGVNLNNTVSNNYFKGQITYPITVTDQKPDDTNIVANNNYDQFYDYQEEIRLLKGIRIN